MSSLLENRTQTQKANNMNKQDLLDYCDSQQAYLTEELSNTDVSVSRYMLKSRIKEVELFRKFIVNG